MVSGAFDTLSHLMEIYFSAPDADNVSDDISEALMRSVIRNLRAASVTKRITRPEATSCGTPPWPRTAW